MAKRKAKPATMTSLTFFAQLNWIDGKPLLPTIEEYRRRIFTAALDTFDDDGVPGARRSGQEELQILRPDPRLAL